MLPATEPTIADPQTAFLEQLPRFEVHARYAFRPVRCHATGADLMAETLALAWRHFAALALRGRHPETFVTTLALRCSQAVAKNILTVRLRKLVALGVLEQVPGEGPYHEYALTEKGRGLYLVLMAIRQWGEGCGGEAPYVLVDRRAGKPVKPLGVHAHDGRELGADDVELVPAADA